MVAVGVCCCWSLELPANAKRQDKPAVFSKAGENPTVYFQPGTGKGVEACKGRVLLKQRPHRLLGLEASGATGERSERSLALRQLTGHTHTHISHFKLTLSKTWDRLEAKPEKTACLPPPPHRPVQKETSGDTKVWKII